PRPERAAARGVRGRAASSARGGGGAVGGPTGEAARGGGLPPVRGGAPRGGARLAPPVLRPPSRRELRRYAVPMLGVYPARGCPYTCNFCSVIKIAGRQVRREPVETTLATLRAARDAGVRLVMFTSDNFNKI